MQKITTFLAFDNQAEEAVNFYVSLFQNSRILHVARNDDGEDGQEGTAFHITFELDGQEFMALNGGPYFTFSHAISLFVRCDSQEEIDRLWGRLTDGGEEVQCGWLKDRFGVSWQIAPTEFEEMMRNGTPEQAKRVMDALLEMVKIDIATLRRAYEQA
ncbi:VOC family protein [Candidatus Poribacteria bacterium]|nr:VOC family protein [Candidatus Poribacteria bacterium]